jgi:CBS domain-containing protein
MIAKIFISLLLIEYGNPTMAFSGQRVFVSKPHRQNVKIVSDLMTQDPFTLSPSTPVDEALSDLLLAGVSGAPVVERLKTQDGKIELSLVGFVSSFDFLPREEDGLVMLGAMEDSETARRILGQNVGDIMSKNPVTITNNDLMKTAAEKMAKHR